MDTDPIDSPEYQKEVDETLGGEGSRPTRTSSQASPSSPLESTPTKSTLKALPTVRDHTTDQLGPGGDEYLPREIDEAGEKKLMPNGALNGGREYRCRTFQVPKRGDKWFMLATECARVLGYRDSYLLFNKNRSLFNIVANQTEKDDLVSQDILPFSYRSRQIAIVTARSIFRQFGSRVIVNGKRVRDDYWELKARKQGFTEADLAGEKRPGASTAREAVAAAEVNASRFGERLVQIDDPTLFTLHPQHHPRGVTAKYPISEASSISELTQLPNSIEELEQDDDRLWESIPKLPGIRSNRSFLQDEREPRRAGATGPAFVNPDTIVPPHMENFRPPTMPDQSARVRDQEEGGSLIRRPSLTRRSPTRQDADGLRMPPPPRPNTMRPELTSPFTLPALKRQSIKSNGLLDDDESLDESSLYGGLSPAEQYSREQYFHQGRRQSLDSAAKYSTKYPYSKVGRISQRDSHYGVRRQLTEQEVDNKVKAAQQYQEDVVDGPTNILTADDLRRINKTPSKSTQGDSGYGRSVSSRNSMDPDDMTIFVKGMGSLTIGNAQLDIRDGAEIAIRTNSSERNSRGGSDNASSAYHEDSRTTRFERLSPEPEFRSKVNRLVDNARSPHVQPRDLTDDQSAALYASRDLSPETSPQSIEPLYQSRASGTKSGNKFYDWDETFRMYTHHKPEEESALDLRVPEVSARVIAQWSSAQSTEAQLDLLHSLAKHRPKDLPEAVGVGSTWQGWLRCEWELPRVVRELQESQSSDVKSILGNFVTITGGRSGIECSTCAQFLEKTWKESGRMALDVLSRGVSSVKHDSKSSSVSFRGVIIHAMDDLIFMRIGEDQQDAQAFVDAVVWVCSAVRVNPQRQANTGQRSQLQLSKAIQLLFINSTGPQALIYGLDELVECSDKDLDPQAKCWTGLFRSGIVAFHPLERRWGAGLEISFDMLLELSGVENVYQFEGGIILAGFFTALVPISRDEATNSVQWHFEEVDGSSGELLKPYSLPSVHRDWYRCQDLDMLRTSKCFVGWFARANILLGTRQLVANSGNRLSWSTDTKEHHQSARREGFEASGQLGFTAGPINTVLQLTSAWRFHSNVQHFHRHEQYSIALRLGRGYVAAIIDSESKQVWLVPMLSLVLHLCHRYFQEFNCSGQADSPLPFADPSPDGAAEAARVLESSGDVLVFGAAGGPDAENLRQLFLRINTNLLNASGTREQSNKKKLFASELMAMVTEPGRGSPLKEMKTPADAESWVGLLERVDFVGVCSDIGPLIEPEPPSLNPCSCSALPCDRYFLAAHMRCLDALSQRQGHSMSNSLDRVCRLGEKVFWNMEKLHWTSCPAGGHETIWNEKNKILQQISSKGKGKGKNVAGLNRQIALQQHLPEDGVVVFGGDATKRVLQSIRWNEYI